MPALLDDVLKLSVDERIELVGHIWKSISDDSALPELRDDQKQELDRRLAAHQANPKSAVPWEEVKQAAFM